VDPWTDRTVADLLTNLERRPSYLALDGADFRIDAPIAAELPRVFQKVVEDLGATRLMRNELIHRPRFRFDSLSIQYAKIQALGRALEAKRWPAAALGERWVVSDFCLEQELNRGNAEHVRRALRNRGVANVPLAMSWLEPSALSMARCALQPTFVVLLGGHRFIPDVTSPTLTPRSQDPQAVAAEIVTACTGTRA
jgi:hypothetical protein